MAGPEDRYELRTYRDRLAADDLVGFNARYRETDLWIAAGKELKDEAFRAIRSVRRELEAYIRTDKRFAETLEPLQVPDTAPAVVRQMAEMAARAGVGPMAAVAGAIAEAVGRELLAGGTQVIVENGGDIFIKSDRPRTGEVLVPPESPFFRKVFLALKPVKDGFGLCTSSGTIGHSLSRGSADAVVVKAACTALADAAATAIGNRVTAPDQVKKALAFGQNIKGLDGILIITGDKMGAWGDLEIAG